LTSGQSGYDGGSNAWKLDKSATSYTSVYQDVSQSGVQTISIYVKEGTLNTGALYADGGTADYSVFDLTNGNNSTNTSGVIDAGSTNEGNGWYRLYMVVNKSVTRVRFYPDWSNSTAGNVYVQDFQLNQGLIPQEVITTTTSAVYGGITDNTPRLDYTDSSCPALLLEPQRTNDVEHSEYFEGSGWGLLQASLTANNSNSPEGLQNAYSFVPNTTNTTHLVYETITKSAGTYTASCFFKADGYDYGNIRLATDSDAKRYSVTIDLTDGTFASQDTYGSPTSTGYKIEDIGNGWYRLSLTSAHSSGFMYHTISLSNVASPTYNNGLPQFAGDGTKGVLIYGAQLEQGSYATSYIPTYGSSVSRVSETCEVTSVSSLIGQEQGTMYWDINFIDNGGYPAIFLYDGTSNNRLLIQRRGNNNVMQTQVRSLGSLQADYLTSTAITNGNHKMAIAYATNDFQSYLDGSSAGSDSSGVTYTNQLSQISLKPNEASIRINQVLIFKTRLSNEELAALTTI
jgi:hypothetical protein